MSLSEVSLGGRQEASGFGTALASAIVKGRKAIDPRPLASEAFGTGLASLGEEGVGAVGAGTSRH